MPENQSEGAGSNAPEDVLFADSESTSADAPQQQPEAQPQPQSEPVEQPSESTSDESPAKALDDPSPSEALGSDEGEGEAAEAPTSYEDFDIPEGAEGVMGESVIAAFSDVARELGLSQEQAQKVIATMGGAQLEAQQSVVANAIDSWAKQTRDDKEVGGAHYRTALADARRTIDRFGTPELKQLLVGKTTQLANHPEMLRLLSRVGKAISVDRALVRGRQPSTEQKVNMEDPLATEQATAELMFGKADI